MSSLEELRQVRLDKKEKLEKAGMGVYPSKVDFDMTLKEVVENFKEDKEVKLVGRIMSLRPQGGLIFFNFYDGTETFQGILKSEEIDEKIFSLFEETADIGDFVQVEGKLFTTKRGQQSVLVSDWKMLSKSLRPLPEKWHGLQDVEERYRKRYLDLLMNSEEKELFIRKAKFWNVVRNFFNNKGFLEVETPTLEITTGGAEARPFVTHHNDFDMDLFLRISVGELWQKRLMAAGFPKTFEIGRAFRNEGTSPEHLQEFTNLEFYWAYADYNDGMDLTTELYREIAQKVFETTKFDARGHKFDLNDDWKRIDYKQEVLDKTGIDILESSEEDMKKRLEELGVEYDGENRERLTDTLWKYCRKQISGPAFLINHPKIVAPLAKLTKDNPELVERFQVILAGSEIGNGYSELNDPIDQKERFELQQKLIDAGDEEAMMPDWEFVEMLEHGMPPTCGFGFGERLFSTLSDKPIRETQLFPLMRPFRSESNKEKKSKETKTAIVVLNKSAGLENWEELNTVAHLNASFAARKGRELFLHDTITTKDAKKLKLNIQHAIMIKETEKGNELVKLVEETESLNLDTVVFTREMIETTNDKKVIEKTKDKELKDIEYLGVLIFGKKSVVDNLTNNFSLYD